MILDNEVKLTNNVTFDLGTKKPGPGQSIKLFASGVGSFISIDHGATAGALSLLLSLDALDDVEFELPSNTRQYIVVKFTGGSVTMSLGGNQTAT